MTVRAPINFTFYEVLTAAVRDISEHGYDNPARLADWLRKLRVAANVQLPSSDVMQNQMERALERAFQRSISKAAVLRHHPGVSKFTVDQIAPELRSELRRRIFASADLIKLNREQAIEKTLQRFSGWATSIPDGGSKVVDRAEVKGHIAKALRSGTYEERRLAIDQGHKLLSSVSAVIGIQTGAIAAMWRSNWRQPGYDYRPDHKERDKRIYAVRGSWAMDQGLLKKGNGYIDEITQPAEEPFCRCYYVYLNNLRDVPDSMLTEKGRRVLEDTRLRP